MSITGLAARPDTAVDPKWCTSTPVGSIGASRSRSASKAVGHAGSYSTISTGALRPPARARSSAAALRLSGAIPPRSLSDRRGAGEHRRRAADDCAPGTEPRVVRRATAPSCLGGSGRSPRSSDAVRRYPRQEPTRLGTPPPRPLFPQQRPDPGSGARGRHLALADSGRHSLPQGSAGDAGTRGIRAARVGPHPSRDRHPTRNAQHRRPGADRERQQVREDEREQAHAEQPQCRPRAVPLHPDPTAPRSADQQDDPAEGPRAGADRDGVAEDQGPGREWRCGRDSHIVQPNVLSIPHDRSGGPALDPDRACGWGHVTWSSEWRGRPTNVQAMALIRASGPLSRALRESLPERPFHVRFWDGGRVEATSGGAPTFSVRRPSALAHILRAPGTLGLGRAYVDGSLDVDDLDAAFIVVDEWEPPPLSLAARARLGLGLVLAALPGGLPHRPSLELILRGERHSPQRDAAAIRYHYDVGNEFFALFLDESMTYSCAIYSRGAQTLAQAQLAKLDLIAQKLELAPGMAVLDVGCGWG